MPPIEPSLRASLLTGASALAMSVSASGVYAQTAGSPPPMPAPTIAFWLEGALAYTGGGSFNIPALPGLGTPFTSFNPRSGPEGAFGFDYRFQNQPWHFVFDFRFGRSGTSTANSASSSSSSSHSFQTFSSFPFTSVVTTDQSTANSSATQASQRERHLVADFMIGRDLGVGSNAAEIQFGFRIADLHASAQAQQNAQSTTTTTTTVQGFYAPSFLSLARPSAVPIFSSATTTTSSSSSASYATWNSRFFGAGPRLAIAGSAPIMGAWTFDYGAGIAGLVADRSFDVRVWNNPGTIFAANSPSRGFVFNADAMLALSYRFTPHYKLTAGLRADFYDAALTTYDVNTGGLTNVNRTYWGPFARLTGSF